MPGLRINLSGESRPVSKEAEAGPTRELQGDLGVQALAGIRQESLARKVQGLSEMRGLAAKKGLDSGTPEVALPPTSDEILDRLRDLSEALQPGDFRLSIVRDEERLEARADFYDGRPPLDVTDLMTPGVGIIERVKVHSNGSEDRTSFDIYKLVEGRDGADSKVVLKSSRGMRTPLEARQLGAAPDAAGSYWKILPPSRE